MANELPALQESERPILDTVKVGVRSCMRMQDVISLPLSAGFSLRPSGQGHECLWHVYIGSSDDTGHVFALSSQSDMKNFSESLKRFFGWKDEMLNSTTMDPKVHAISTKSATRLDSDFFCRQQFSTVRFL